jgi:threonyl-tRNA synthetase
MLLTRAARAFERYLASGGARAIGLLELARTQLALGLPSGATAYYGGASLDDAEATAGYRADLDERGETVSKRIRDAELEKVPKVIVYGDRESDEALAVRDRGGGQSTARLEELLAHLATLIAMISFC